MKDKQAAREIIELLNDCKYPIEHINNSNHDESKLLARISQKINELESFVKQNLNPNQINLGNVPDKL